VPTYLQVGAGAAGAAFSNTEITLVLLNVLAALKCTITRVCTISATDHIGHNHIGHKPYRPQPHRPHEKTISAKTNNHIGHKNRTAI